MSKYKVAGFIFIALAMIDIFIHDKIGWQTFSIIAVMCFIASDYFGSKQS